MSEPETYSAMEIGQGPVNLTANLSAVIYDWTGVPYASSVLNESVLGVFVLNE